MEAAFVKESRVGAFVSMEPSINRSNVGRSVYGDTCVSIVDGEIKSEDSSRTPSYSR